VIRPMPRPDSLAVTALLTALVAVGSFSTSIYVPSMPALAAEFATTPDRVKLTLTLFLFGFALGQLVYGPASDRLGRRGVLVAGLGLYLAGSLACALAPSIGTMIAARFLQAAGACAGAALGRAVVRDVHGRAGTQRVFGWIGAATALSPAIAPTLGGHFHVWFGWRANFVLLAALGAALLLGVLALLPETNRRRDPQATGIGRMAANYRLLLADRRFLGYLLCGSLLYAGLYAYIAVTPFLFIERLGLSPETYGTLTLFTTGSYLAGSLAAARLGGRLGVDGLVLAGAAVALAGAAAMAALAFLVLSVATLLGPMMLFSVGLGLLLPSAMAGGMLPFPQIAGAASALLGFCQMLLAALATFATAALPRASAIGMAAMLVALAGAALAARLTLLRGGEPPG
jgi:MFS transporter, DHA1 family, multidrug resistance protein